MLKNISFLAIATMKQIRFLNYQFVLIKPTKNMKKVIYALILPLVVVSGLAFANRGVKNEPSEKSASKPSSAAEKEAERKKKRLLRRVLSSKNGKRLPRVKKCFPVLKTGKLTFSLSPITFCTVSSQNITKPFQNTSKIKQQQKGQSAGLPYWYTLR